MKIQQKFITSVLVLIFALCIFTGGATAAEVASGSCGENVTWVLDDAGVLTISGSGAMDDYTKNDEQPWYDYRDYITEIAIDDGVTHIGSYAFAYLPKITETEFGAGVTSVGNSAFYSCSALKVVTIPDTVTSVGKDVFRGCKSIDTVKLPNAETTYGAGVFQSCSALKKIDIPEKMTVIPNYMFYYCSSLTEVNFHDNVTEIGAGAFGYCFDNGTGDLQVTLPKNLKTINGNAFEYAKMKNIILPEGLTTIKSKAFSRCANLEKIIIPSTMTTIEASVFAYCNALCEINMPTVTTIGEDAFYGIGAESVVLPEGLTTIGKNAFSSSKLKEVVFPKSVTEIGAGAFSSSKLEKVTFPGSVTVLGDSMFQYCKSLTEATIEEGVTQIGSWAFGYCTALEKVNLPKSLTEITTRAFTGCKAVKSIEIPEKVTAINAIFSNCLALEEIIIPQSVVLIDSNAFDGAPETVVVKGYSGSEAEEYAQNNGYTFEALGEITEQVVLGGALSDSVNWSLTNTGKLIFSGEGAVPDVSTMPWKDYNNAIKTIFVEEGIISVGKMDFNYTRNIEKVSIHYSVKSFDENTLKSIVSSAVFEGYSKTWVEYLVTKNSRTFVALDEAPYHEMVSGKMTNENITWALDNCGALVIKGSGKMSSYHSTSVPWYKYRSLIEKVTVCEGVTTVTDLYFDEITNLKEIEIAHTVGYISQRFSDVAKSITIKGYNDSYTEHSATSRGLNFVSLGEADEVIISTGEAGDNKNATYTVSSKGVLTISGTGTTEYCSSDFARSWDYYDTYIKKVVIEKGITSLRTFYLSGCTNLETIEISYSVLGISIIDAPENLVVKGYTNSKAETWAGENNLTFESLGIMPEDSVVGGTIGEAEWSLNGYGLLTLSGSGEIEVDYTSNYPWYGYSDYILEIVANEGITRLGYHAFYWCDNLKKITLPLSMEYIDTYNLPRQITFCIYQYSAMHDQLDDSRYFTLEFIGKAPLVLVEEGTFGDNITWRYYSHRILEIEGTGDMPKDIEIPWKNYKTKLETITMPDTITSIAPYAFTGARVEEITIPSAVTVIGAGAFNDLKNVKEIVVPESVTQIGNRAFAACTTLEKITLSSNIILANFNIFDYNTNLKEICGKNDTFAERAAAQLNKVYGTEFVSLGEAPERECITVSVSDTVYFEVDNLGDFIFLGTGDIPDMTDVGPDNRPWKPYLTDNSDNIIISGTIQKIGNNAFSSYKHGNFVIEEGVKEIGEYTFAGLPITEIKIPDSVETIGKGAFNRCESLEKAWVGKDVEIIPAYCFGYCYNLEFVEFPEWIDTIEENAFYNANFVKFIHYRGTEWHWNYYVTGEENLPAKATLIFESYLPEEVTCEITNVEKLKTSVEVTVSYALCGDEHAYIAAYNADGDLIEVVSIELGKDTYTLNKNTAVVKVIVWDGNMIPLAQAATKEL